MSENFLTRSKFSKEVESAVTSSKMTYIDAVVYVCEQKGVDPSDVKKFLNKMIKEKLEQEARDLNFLPKGNQLPV